MIPRYDRSLFEYVFEFAILSTAYIKYTTPHRFKARRPMEQCTSCHMGSLLLKWLNCGKVGSSFLWESWTLEQGYAKTPRICK